MCPQELRLDGKRVLVTGGNAGIGLATCRGLLQRGAKVVMASRNAHKAGTACAELRKELGDAIPISFCELDLANLESVREATTEREKDHPDQPFDVLICNAGVWPRTHSTSPQGHEQAFATNVLGHHLLIRRGLEGILSAAARVVILTGDIYILARDCTPDFTYHTPLGGMLAYCRSKLGNLWLAHELRLRQPELSVAIVHPGVVASNLGGQGGADGLRERIMLDTGRGAQTSLFAAAARELPPNSYLHNSLGHVSLSLDDPARDARKAERLWSQCEALCRDYLA